MPISRSELELAHAELLDIEADLFDPIERRGTAAQRVFARTLLADFDRFLADLRSDSPNTGARAHPVYVRVTDDLIDGLESLAVRVGAF